MTTRKIKLKRKIRKIKYGVKEPNKDIKFFTSRKAQKSFFMKSKKGSWVLSTGDVELLKG